MKITHLTLLSLLATTSAVFGQSAATLVNPTPSGASSHQFVQNGRQMELKLCAYEICRPDEKGNLTVERVVAGSNAAVIRQASVPDEENYLVFYPAGKEGLEDERRILRKRYLVTLADNADLNAIQGRCGMASIKLAYPGGNIAICEEESAGRVLSQLNAVMSDPQIISVEPLLAKKRFKKLVPTDPFYSPGGRADTAYQWYLNNTGENGGLVGIDINLELALDRATGADVTVGVVDDGLAIDHVDLTVNAIGPHLNLNGGLGTVNDPTSFNEFDTHGTEVGGIIGAAFNNMIGISGVAPESRLAGIRLIAAPADDAQEAEALRFSPNTISVYNNSWGPSDETLDFENPGSLTLQALEDGAKLGRANLGSIYVWAGGNGGEINDNSNFDGYANSPYTIAVGAISDTGKKAVFSERGANLVVCGLSGGGAQGILTTTYLVDVDEDDMPIRIPTYTPDFGGTSAAAPMVSGVIALMLEVNPLLTERDVQDILIRNSVLVDPSNGDWITNAAMLTFNHDYGAGLVDAQAAVIAASNRTATNSDLTNRPLGPKAPEQKNTVLFDSLSDDPLLNGKIPDNGSGYLATFDMTKDRNGVEFDNLKVEHVQLRLAINTPNRSELDVRLISPNGTESILQEVDLDHEEQSIDNWVFMTVRNWGEGSKGTWAVQVTDRISGNEAVFDSATLTIHGSADPSAPVSSGPLLVSNRLITVDQAEEFSYTIDAISENSVTVGDLPEGVSYDPDTMVISGAPVEAGVYQLQLSLVGDNGISTPTITLVVRPTSVALGDALGLPDFPAFVGGDKPWDFEFVDTNDPGVPDDQKVAARSADSLGDARQSIFGFDEIGESVIVFDWKTSSEEGADRLYFNRGGTVPQFWEAFISGEREYATIAVQLPNESNSVRWIYSKDPFDDQKLGTNSVGEDRGLVDNVRLVPSEKYRQDMAEAANITGFDFVVDGRTMWLPFPFRGGSSFEGGEKAVLRSPAIGNGQTVSLSGWVEGPGTFEFTGSNFAETGDVFEFLLDGAVVKSVDGEASSTTLTTSQRISEGRHYLQLRFRKDFRGSGGRSFGSLGIESFDGIILDDIAYVADGSVAALLAGLAGGVYGDEDKDGYSNQLEVAFGGDINIPDIPRYLPKVVNLDNGDRVIEFGIDTSLNGVEFEAQESSSLEEDSWVETSRSTMVRAEGDVEVYQIPVTAIPGAPKTFFRVIATME